MLRKKAVGIGSFRAGARRDWMTDWLVAESKLQLIQYRI